MTPPPQWQYKVLKIPATGMFCPSVNEMSMEQFLNHHGAYGWELVSMVDMNTGNGATIELVLTLKRPAARGQPTSGTPPPLPPEG